MRKLFLGLTLVSVSASLMYAQDEFDDIYYNPDASKSESVKTVSKSSSKKNSKSKKQTNYIADFSNMDVDDYNRRGFYYESEIDTIGERAEAGEDFVYTQQIQKYYNPTVVVDNADILADLLENSYGNVDIVIKDNNPVFTSIYYGDYGWSPTYYNWSYRPAWTWSYAWGPVSWSWTFGPSWTWGWGPTWSYAPVWGYGPGWGYGPFWGYTPWRPPHHHHHHYASYNRPGAYRPVSPGAGWSSSSRPGGNRNHGVTRPGYSGRPGSMAASRPSVGRPTTSVAPALRGDRNQRALGSGRPASRGEATLHNKKTSIGSIKSSDLGKGSGNRTMGERKEYNSNRSVGTSTTSVRNSDRTSHSTSTNKATNSTVTNRGNTSTTYNSGTRNNNSRSTTNNNRSYNSGSSNRSYNSGSSSRSNFGGSRGGGSYSGGSRGGGSHGGGRGGRR